MTQYMTGWAHSPFGRLDDHNVESLMRETANAALAHAQLEAKDIDAIYVGHFNEGFDDQGFSASLSTLIDPAFRHTPTTRLENACATGSAAIHAGLTFLEAGLGKNVLVIGVEKMMHLDAKRVGDLLVKASYRAEENHIKGGFVGVFAEIAKAYFQRHGDHSLALAQIAAKNHQNGCANPYAQMRRAFDVDFCQTLSDKNPMVVDPLRRTDCSLISDGAAALVLSTEDRAKTAPQAVKFKARAHVSDYFPMSKRDMTRFSGAELAWQKALSSAGLSSVLDLDLVETHDCFTIAELIEYEAMGLTPFGEGHRALAEGWTQKDGKMPVNASGGLKAKGHPIGATGVSMHVVTAQQLTDTAGEMQIPNAARAGIFNMGGAAVANYVSILEQYK